MKIYVKINLMILNFLFKIYCVPACFLYNNHGLIKTNQKVSNCKQKEAEMYDIGSRIKALRTKNGLTLEELGSRTELTKGFLSQLERNLTSPSLTTLEDIVEALGVSMSKFFADDDEEQIVFTKDDIFVDEQEERTINWIVPSAQKNKMEPLILELEPGCSSKEIEPHDGEEFGYVLQGRIQIRRESDSRKLIVKKGETFYIKGNESHCLVNTGQAAAKVLWISTPPIF